MGGLLLAFLIVAGLAPLLTRWLGSRSFYLAALVPAAAFAYTLTQTPVALAGGAATESVPWIGELGVALSFRVDALAWVMALVVSGVGCLVLLYCVRYFSADDEGVGRFCAYLLGFAGAMYGLVTADDVIVLYLFWEITSVLSYLLIGHFKRRSESRGAALQALIVTTFGGLAMLVGVVILATEGGTTSLSQLVAHPPQGGTAGVAVILVLVGALSKSALIPFHFWLPSAMAAPTPVSAYLHAAAMVKAGVYLVARLVPGFGDVPGWQAIIVSLGLWTMLVGGWRALRQYDLKLVLAYSTVSQLGFMTLAVGFGSRDAALAGLTVLVAHALYKAALFLAVGVIEKRTGTRDWRMLSGLGRRAPVLAAVSGVALASMAGIPPLIGFVGKDAVFAALLEAGSAGEGWGWIALAGVCLGSALTVAYCARFFWGAFATHGDVAQQPLAPASVELLAAPTVLAAASLAAGLAAGPLGSALAVAADPVGGGGDYHLALWHGFGLEPLLSLAVLIAGAALFWARRRVARLQDAVPPLVDVAHGYGMIVAAVNRFAARLTIFAQRGGLSQYLATILVVFVLALGAAAALNRSWPGDIVWWDYPGQLIVAAVMTVAAVTAARARQRVTAAILVGVTGFGLVALFALHGAPDLALTQALVETVTLVAFVLVMRRLPTRIAQHHKPQQRSRRALIGILVGGVMATIGMIALGARQEATISRELPPLIAKHGHGDNIVNAMLVDTRAWDTMGEISVLVVVATGIASLLFVSGRATTIQRMRDSRQLRSPANRGRVVADPAASSEGHAVTRQSWLVAGRAMPERERSIMLEVLVRLLFHPAMVVSVFVLLVGHNLPGGGFAGGLVAGLALASRYIVGGRYELAEAAPIDPGKLLGIGILLAAGTAAASLVFGAPPLTSAFFEAEIPVLGRLEFSTTTIFDVGVYLVVVGLTLDLLRSLGSEVDRQREAPKPGGRRGARQRRQAAGKGGAR